MFQLLSELCEEIATKFIENGALTPETAKTLEELSIIGVYYQQAVKSMKSRWLVKRVNKTRYYLDEKAWAHPNKAFTKKFLFLFAIIFPAMLILVLVMVLLSEYGIIS
jgi:hypothetical protein